MADKTFDLDGIFSSARSVVSDALLEIGRTCPSAVVLTADLARTNQLVPFQEQMLLCFQEAQPEPVRTLESTLAQVVPGPPHSQLRGHSTHHGWRGSLLPPRTL